MVRSYGNSVSIGSVDTTTTAAYEQVSGYGTCPMDMGLDMP